MLIEQEETGNEGAFFVKNGSEMIAEMVYSLAGGDTMIIEHTFVEEDARGKNIGYGMLQKAAAYAREKKLSIIPRCSFVNAVFGKEPEQFRDLQKKP